MALSQPAFSVVQLFGSPSRRLGRLLLALFLVEMALFISASASAASGNGDEEERAAAFITEKHGALLEILKRPKSGARDKEIASLLGGLLDYERIAESSLGGGWEELAATDRARFEELLSALIERSYIASLEETKHFSIRYLGSRAEGERYLVETEARDQKNRRAPPIAMSYRLMRVGESFRVVDIVTDGVSLINNYRNQFSRILARDGFEALIAKMRSRLSEG